WCKAVTLVAGGLAVSWRTFLPQLAPGVAARRISCPHNSPLRHVSGSLHQQSCAPNDVGPLQPLGEGGLPQRFSVGVATSRRRRWHGLNASPPKQKGGRQEFSLPRAARVTAYQMLPALGGNRAGTLRAPSEAQPDHLLHPECVNLFVQHANRSGLYNLLWHL